MFHDYIVFTLGIAPTEVISILKENLKIILDLE